jgi:hypothetical protein
MRRENIEEKIQDLIDGRLSKKDAEAVRAHIAKDEYLRLFYQSLKEVDMSLQRSALSHPSEGFTDNVMQSLYRPKPHSIDFKSVLILLGLVICATVGLVYSSRVNLPLPEISPLITKITFLEKVQISLPKIVLPPPEFFLNTLYFGLLFLALIYFDRVILKQFFRNKYRVDSSGISRE